MKKNTLNSIRWERNYSVYRLKGALSTLLNISNSERTEPLEASLLQSAAEKVQETLNIWSNNTKRIIKKEK